MLLSIITEKMCKSIKVSSLTYLFVYKVLNQEVLDDRGNLQLSVTQIMKAK